MIGMISLVSFWMLYPYNPLVFNTQPGKVFNPVVKGGDHLSIEVDYCKNIDIGAEMTTSFVDGFIYNTTPIISNMPVGCHKITMEVYVPKALPTGVYTDRTVFRYKLNPLRTIDVIGETSQFTVTK
jgi:hypothetical protein